MSYFTSDFDKIMESDLRRLLGIAAEGLRLEFKQNIYGRADADVKELLKDVSAFANSSGGDLIIGLAAVKGIATSVAPLVIDMDVEIGRIENILASSVEPRIIGLKIRSIAVNGGSAIVVRISKSWIAPHRISYKGATKFYLRNSNGVYEASVDEIRNMILRTAHTNELVKKFREERLALIRSGTGPISVAGGEDKFVLHLMPVAAASGVTEVDIAKAVGQRSLWKPIGASRSDPRANFDGVVSVRATVPTHGYVQLFRNGAVEALKTNVLRVIDEDSVLDRGAMEDWTILGLDLYMAGLNSLDVPPPIVVMPTLLGMKGVWFGHDAILKEDENHTVFDREEMLLPAILIDEYGTKEDYKSLCKPAFDALWNAAGFLQSR